ncbi:MAG TPA: hypothetical protein VH479_24035 [Acidimicrobiales bacterium]|jgi:hypothetical protein
MPVAIVVALVGLVLWDASGRPAILDPLFLGALAVGAVGGWSLVRAIRDGRAKRRRGVEDRR